MGTDLLRGKSCRIWGHLLPASHITPKSRSIPAGRHIAERWGIETQLQMKILEPTRAHAAGQALELAAMHRPAASQCPCDIGVAHNWIAAAWLDWHLPLGLGPLQALSTQTSKR